MDTYSARHYSPALCLSCMLILTVLQSGPDNHPHLIGEKTVPREASGTGLRPQERLGGTGDASEAEGRRPAGCLEEVTSEEKPGKW